MHGQGYYKSHGNKQPKRSGDYRELTEMMRTWHVEAKPSLVRRAVTRNAR